MNVLDYPVSLRPMSEDEGGGFLAFAPDLPGCMSDGETQEEALKNLRDAMEAWLEEARALGRDIPVPKPIVMSA